MKAAGSAGFLGINKPQEYGGSGLDHSFAIVAAEEWGRSEPGGAAVGVGVQTDMSTPALAKHGSHELKKEYLTRAISGELIFCIGISEEGAGSDVASIKSAARSDGDDYVISGSKMWISNATQADVMVGLVNTSDGKPHRNKSLIIIPMDTKGVSVSPPFKKLGGHSSDTAQVFFDDVRVPKSNRIGEEGMGFIYQMQQFQEERMFAAAKAVVQLQRVVDLTCDYTGGRKAFGKPVRDNQVVYHKLAEMQTQIEALRSLTYRAVEAYARGEDVIQLASMAKYLTGRLAIDIPTNALQYWGGQGYMWENPVSKLMRDLRLIAVGAGANEVMLEIIAKQMGIFPKN
jgi:citronellyl-CoA dehydrogenase